MPPITAASHRRAEGLDGDEGARQVLGGRLAHMTDAEREDEALEADAAPRVDGAEQVLDRLGAACPCGPSSRFERALSRSLAA